MLLSLKKNTTATATQTKTVATYNNPRLHHTWRCYQASALNNQHVGPKSHAPLSP